MTDMRGALPIDENSDGIAITGAHDTLPKAIEMASAYPAAFLNLGESHGRIEAGFVADLVALDDDLSVARTWISGKPSEP